MTYNLICAWFFYDENVKFCQTDACFDSIVHGSCIGRAKSFVLSVDALNNEKITKIRRILYHG